MTLTQHVRVVLVAAAALAGVPVASGLAQGPRVGPKIGVGLGFGSLGLGGDLTVGLTRRLELRGGGNYFTLTLNNKTISDVQYSVDARWRSGMLLGDLYLVGPLRVTGGVTWNGNKLTIDANPTVSVTIGDTTYQASDIGTIHGVIDFKKIAPYLGIGIAGRGRVSPVLQLGALFSGSPQVGYTATTTLTGAAKTEFDSEVAKEVTKIRDDLSIFKYYPHVAFGLAVRF